MKGLSRLAHRLGVARRTLSREVFPREFDHRLMCLLMPLRSRFFLGPSLFDETESAAQNDIVRRFSGTRVVVSERVPVPQDV